MLIARADKEIEINRSIGQLEGKLEILIHDRENQNKNTNYYSIDQTIPKY